MLPCPSAVCACCWVGGYPLLLHPADARLGRELPCLGIPLQPLVVQCRHVLLGEGSPTSFPPWWPHALSECDRSVGSATCCRPPASHVLGSHAAQSCLRPMSPFTPCFLSPLWTRGRPPLPGDPCWLNPPLAPPVPVCHNHGASACRFQSWRRRHRRISVAGATRCRRPPPFPSLGAAAPPSSARVS